MSVTTTANPMSGTVLQVLTDYDLHHSGDPARPRTPEAPNKRTTSLRTALNHPEDWDNAHRRVPAYRPVDPSLGGPERPDGVNPIEKTFIFVMLNGVGLMANISTVWRMTGGKLNDQIFKHKIGGEW